jgi:hypothetical protein
MEVDFLESEKSSGSKMKNMPEPEVTDEGKFKCRMDLKEYETREGYEQHCREEHDVM